MWKPAVIGLTIRIIAIFLFSQGDNYQDGVFKNIVDVDYKVFLDASLYHSPYERHTYRYSPILATLVSPSYNHHQLFGKVVMAAFDFISILFLYKIFQKRGSQKQLANDKAAKIVSYFYALNPILIYVTVRGSCQGITMALASAFWYFYIGGKCNGNMSPLERNDKEIMERQPDILKRYISYAIFGLWVHFRVYPIIFVPMLVMHQYYSVRQNRAKRAIQFVTQFGLVSGGVFLALGAFYYSLYGWQFIDSTYLYHLTRRDNRHSKSVYFYEIYLNYSSDQLKMSATRTIQRLLPSLLAILTTSLILVRKRSLFFCAGLIMFYFVTFNRVITDQYYMWSFCSMYMVIPQFQSFRQMKWRVAINRALREHLVLPLPVFLWLMMALKLQQSVPDVHIYHVWMASLFILVIHVVLITRYYFQIKPYSMVNQKKRELQNAKKLLSANKKKRV